MAGIWIHQVVTGNCTNVKGATFVLQVFEICEKLEWRSFYVMPCERDFFALTWKKTLFPHFTRKCNRFEGNINSHTKINGFYLYKL